MPVAWSGRDEVDTLRRWEDADDLRVGAFSSHALGCSSATEEDADPSIIIRLQCLLVVLL